MKARQGVLPLDFVGEDKTQVTGRAGLVVVAEAFRVLGGFGVCEKELALKRRRKLGLSEAEMVESFVLLLAGGGDCVDDFEHLRGDVVLQQMVGHSFPSPTAAWEFLGACGAVGGGPLFSQEGRESRPGLEALALVNQKLVAAVAEKLGVEEATLDIDAKVYESHKREAEPTYLGVPGYQPVIGVFAELDMILVDEFRQGNVPAGKDLNEVYRRAKAMLPSKVKKVRVRSDSAGYQHRFLGAMVEDGVEFAVGVDMTPALRQACSELAEEAWQPLDETEDFVRHWADVPYVPTVPNWRKNHPPERYIVWRALPKQGHLFADGSKVKFFGIVTNMDWDGPRLIRWYWEKQGTVENVHRSLCSDLGVGVIPSKHFGIDACYFCLNVLTHNLLEAMKCLVLEPELRHARAKRLRFLVFSLAGRLVRHARRMIAKLSGWLEGVRLFFELRKRLAALAAAPAG